MKRELLAIILALIVLIAPVPSLAATTLPAEAQDWDIPNGHFYTQTGDGGGKGYAVSDDGAVRFWSEFRRLGGVQAVGYPISSERFTWHGYTSQAFQRVVFQWHPDVRQAYFVNVFDLLSQAGKDDWLIAARQTRAPASWAEQGLSWDSIIRNRLAVLDSYPAIKQQYYAVPGDPVLMNGIPVAPVADLGSAFVLRTQRVVIQQWKQEVPWAARDQVTAANGGDIGKELALYRPDAVAARPSRFAADGKPLPPPIPVEKDNLLFVSNRGTARDVYVMNPDGSDVRRLTTNANSKGAAISPDGSRLLYDAVVPGYPPARQIFSMNVDGSDARQLTSSERENFFPIGHPPAP